MIKRLEERLAVSHHAWPLRFSTARVQKHLKHKQPNKTKLNIHYQVKQRNKYMEQKKNEKQSNKPPNKNERTNFLRTATQSP